MCKEFKDKIKPQPVSKSQKANKNHFWPIQEQPCALNPMILYLDENGKCESHKPEPVTITVKELGMKGWLKGER